MFDTETIRARLAAAGESVPDLLKLNVELLAQWVAWQEANQVSDERLRAEREARAEAAHQRTVADIKLVMTHVLETKATASVTAYVPPATGNTLLEVFKEIEDHNERVAYVVSNPRTFADIRKFGRDLLDIETQLVLLQLGVQGCIWGATLLISSAIKENGFFLVGETKDEKPGRVVWLPSASQSA